ncbi:MAG: sporulation protein [Oscillospiraceae bacterium]|nr:sporulation protein [Oscillospiraceae bacterium]
MSEETTDENGLSLSTVTVVHTAEISDQNYEPTDWWKADLDSYDDLSLVTYETVDTPASSEPEFIAEGYDDTISSSVPTASAVSTTADGTFAFTSYGWGHCVGLSQNGANFYAKYAGWSYQDILFHYYPGTTLMNTGTAETEIVTVQGVPGNVLQQVSEIVNIEVGPSFEPECIKAQAVAVYTYMKYHDNDAHDLRGKPNPPQSLVDLCASVLGEALYYDGNYCLTMFYASCGGITANCYDIFSADLPYLRSVASEYDSAYDPHWGDVTYYTIDQVRERIEKAYGIRLSDDPENWIQIIEGNGGYVNRVNVDGQLTVRGNAFRSVMGLKSPKFTYICSIADGSSDDSESDETTEAPEDENGAEINTTEAAADAAEISEVTEPETSEETNTETDLETPPMPTDLSVAEGNDIPDAPLLQ